MDNATVVTNKYKATEVTAIVTAGVEGNGGRAGDPASYNEVRGVEPVGGTIVTMLLVNGDMPEHTWPGP
jgi:adenosylcobinamide hydrolase